MYFISYKVKIEACLLGRSWSCFSRCWLNNLISTGLCNKDMGDNAKILFLLYVRPSKYSPFINHRALRLTSIVFILSNLLLLTFFKSYNSEPFIKCDCETGYTFLIWDHMFFSRPRVVHILELGNSLPTPRIFPRQLTLSITCGFFIHSGTSLSVHHWILGFQKYLGHCRHSYISVDWLNEWMN